MFKRSKIDNVEEYLRAYSLDTGSFDFNGLLHLVLAGVDNLKKHHIDADLESYSCNITDEQAEFLLKILDFRKRFPNGDVE